MSKFDYENYDKYVAPKDYSYDHKSGLYYKQTVTKDSAGRVTQDVTWFNSQTGEYKRVIYPPQNCGPSNVGVVKETRQAGEADKAPEFSAYPYSKREEIEDHLAQDAVPSFTSQEKLDQSFADAVNSDGSKGFWTKFGDNLKAFAGYLSRGKKIPIIILGTLGSAALITGIYWLGNRISPDDKQPVNGRDDSCVTEKIDKEEDNNTNPQDNNQNNQNTQNNNQGTQDNQVAQNDQGTQDNQGGDSAPKPNNSFSLTESNTIIFGHYPHMLLDASEDQYYQDYMYNREEWAYNAPKTDAIEWIVLEDAADSYLLMSKEVLDVVPIGGTLALNYYKTIDDDQDFDAIDAWYADNTPVSWKDTELRNWLNNEFLDYAFTEEEEAILMDMAIDTYDTFGGTCVDRVTIPSKADLETYMPHTRSGDYDFSLIAEATNFSCWEQYAVNVGTTPVQGVIPSGYRVLRRTYHGHSASWGGVILNDTKIKDDLVAAGIPDELLYRRTVSYWLRDLDLTYYTSGPVESYLMFTQGKPTVNTVVTNDGRYWTVGNQILSTQSPFYLENNMNMNYIMDQLFAGIRPIVRISKYEGGATDNGNSGGDGDGGNNGGNEGGNEEPPIEEEEVPPPPPEEEIYYTITFDPNGGEGSMPSVTVEAGPYTLPECSFTRSGYTFKRWDMGKPGTVIEVSSDITVKAKWEEEPGKLSSYFGHYEQDGNTSNGLEPIEWDVLADEGDTVLLISTYVLDNRTYFENYSRGDYVTWDNSYLRSWLNSDFYNTAFDDEEKAYIYARECPADENPDESATSFAGTDTSDFVSILSLSDLYTYFGGSLGSYEDGLFCPRLITTPTEAIKRSKHNKDGIETSIISDIGWRLERYTEYGYTQEDMDKPGCCWWIRTPGVDPFAQCYVNYDGGVNTYGVFAVCNRANTPGVRPVIRVNANVIENAEGIHW